MAWKRPSVRIRYSPQSLLNALKRRFLGKCHRNDTLIISAFPGQLAHLLMENEMIKTYTEPVIRTREGDLSKRWYVEFYCVNPVTKLMVRFQYHCKVNRIKTKKERLSELKAWRDSYSELLFSGWNPYSKEGMTLTALATNKQPVPVLTAFEAVRDLKQKKSPDTIRSYKSITNLFLEWLEKLHPESYSDLASITKQTIRAYSQYMISNRNYSAKTHNNHMAVLTIFFSEFVNTLDLIDANPCKGVKMLKVDEISNVHKAFETDLLKKLTEYLEIHDPELLLFQKFIYYFAIRPKELRLLRISALDLIQCIVTIPGTISKTGQTKTIAIPNAFMPDLEQLQLDRYQSDCYLFSPGGAPGTKPYSKDVMNYRFAKIREKLGIPSGYTNYGFKHTAADALFNLPEKFDKDIQQHFRHASLDQTLKYARNRGKRLNIGLKENNLI